MNKKKSIFLTILPFRFFFKFMLQSHNTPSAGLVSENDGTGHSDSSADSDDSVLKRTARARIAARRIG